MHFQESRRVYTFFGTKIGCPYGFYIPHLPIQTQIYVQWDNTFTGNYPSSSHFGGNTQNGSFLPLYVDLAR